MNESDVLFRYCDLTTANYQALLNARKQGISPHPNMQRAMSDMIEHGSRLTQWGEEMLDRANKMLQANSKTPDGAKSPFERHNQFVPVIGTMVLARRLQNAMFVGMVSPLWKVRSVHIKLLIDIYNHPGLAYRFLCSVYGNGTIKDLLAVDWITGVEMRGYPFNITDKGIQVIEILMGLDKVGKDINRLTEETKKRREKYHEFHS